MLVHFGKVLVDILALDNVDDFVHMAIDTDPPIRVRARMKHLLTKFLQQSCCNKYDYRIFRILFATYPILIGLIARRFFYFLRLEKAKRRLKNYRALLNRLSAKKHLAAVHFDANRQTRFRGSTRRN